MQFRQAPGSSSDPVHAGPHGDDIVYPSIVPFILVHLACFAAIWTGVTFTAAGVGIVLYWLRIFAIGAGYHRYFSHRSYATSRAFQFVLAFLSQSSGQKSVLWWAANHRHHHLHSDTLQDFHSPDRCGFWYSHVGWIFTVKHDTADLTRITDFTCYAELMWLHRHERLPALVLALLTLVIAGWSGLVVGFFWSTVAVYHATFLINSLAHVHGRKRYVTGDNSRNNWLLAVITMGEGWHNNHHAYQSSVRQGFTWWEFDPSFYLLKMLSWVGLVWDLKTPPRAVLLNEQRLGTRVIDRAAMQIRHTFNTPRIAAALSNALGSAPTLMDLRTRLAAAQHSAVDAIMGAQLPELPTREEIRARAAAMFVKTRSMDEIVERAHYMIVEAVCDQLKLLWAAWPGEERPLDRAPASARVAAPWGH
jgi:stearoyl-CoA desaturase (delta-9 desaturase)